MSSALSLFKPTAIHLEQKKFFCPSLNSGFTRMTGVYSKQIQLTNSSSSVNKSTLCSAHRSSGKSVRMCSIYRSKMNLEGRSGKRECLLINQILGAQPAMHPSLQICQSGIHSIPRLSNHQSDIFKISLSRSHSVLLSFSPILIIMEANILIQFFLQLKIKLAANPSIFRHYDNSTIILL